MKKILLALILFTALSANASWECSPIEEKIKRCENDEVICYVYDTGWAGMTHSGRGGGISCKWKD